MGWIPELFLESELTADTYFRSGSDLILQLKKERHNITLIQFIRKHGKSECGQEPTDPSNHRSSRGVQCFWDMILHLQNG